MRLLSTIAGCAFILGILAVVGVILYRINAAVGREAWGTSDTVLVVAIGATLAYAFFRRDPAFPRGEQQ